MNRVASPLNYTGGKYKLLPQILPLFPNDVSTFVDLFCGGCNVAVNVTAQKIICNDSEAHLIGLLEKMKSDGAEKFSREIDSVIQTYNLSDTTKYNYDFYGCNSSAGLGKHNREPFLRLRSHFNSIQSADWAYYYELFALIAYAFNNQIRFNSNGCYNLPIGKRDFNSRMRKKVNDFSAVLQEKKIEFVNQNFERFDFSELTSADFVYADPPYLITTATYNEKKWLERGAGEETARPFGFAFRAEHKIRTFKRAFDRWQGKLNSERLAFRARKLCLPSS